ncbi:MAG: hypothetical protein ACP5GJ_02790 [Nanopusillaceae archaeon]
MSNNIDKIIENSINLFNSIVPDIDIDVNSLKLDKEKISSYVDNLDIENLIDYIYNAVYNEIKKSPQSNKPVKVDNDLGYKNLDNILLTYKMALINTSIIASIIIAISLLYNDQHEKINKEVSSYLEKLKEEKIMNIIKNINNIDLDNINYLSAFSLLLLYNINYLSLLNFLKKGIKPYGIYMATILREKYEIIKSGNANQISTLLNDIYKKIGMLFSENNSLISLLYPMMKIANIVNIPLLKDFISYINNSIYYSDEKTQELLSLLYNSNMEKEDDDISLFF